MSYLSDRTHRRRTALAATVALALGAALGGCANTIEGASKDARKVFGTEGGSPKSEQNPTSTNKKTGWQNPQ